MITAYEAIFSAGKIKKVTYSKETNKFYIRENGMRDAKETGYSKLYKTFEDAKNELIRQEKTVVPEKNCVWKVWYLKKF